MRTSRRHFITTTGLVVGSSAILSSFEVPCSKSASTDYSLLDKVLKIPVLKRDLFPSPVIIESIELLRDRDNFIYRVRSNNGAEGISIGHPFIAKHSYPMFVNILIPYFIGKDARNLDALIYMASESGISVKKQGVPLCVQLAAL